MQSTRPVGVWVEDCAFWGGAKTWLKAQSKGSGQTRLLVSSRRGSGTQAQSKEGFSNQGEMVPQGDSHSLARTDPVLKVFLLRTGGKKAKLMPDDRSAARPESQAAGGFQRGKGATGNALPCAISTLCPSSLANSWEVPQKAVSWVQCSAREWVSLPAPPPRKDRLRR